MTYAEDILNFYQLIGKLKEKQNHDNISKAVLTSIKECQSSRRLSKIDPELLQKSLTKNKVNIVGKGEFLIKQYKKEGLFSDKAEVDIDDLVSSAKEFRGFLDFPNLLYSICCNLVDNNNSSTKDVYLMMCILLSDEAAKAKGNLKGIFKNRMGTPSCVSWYMNLLLGLGGYTRESLKNALKRGENDGR